MTPENSKEGADIQLRAILKGGTALGLAGLIGVPVTGRAMAEDAHPLAGQKIEINILGIAGWGPSSLGVAMSPLFAEYVKSKYGYASLSSFRKRRLLISSKRQPLRLRPKARNSTSSAAYLRHAVDGYRPARH